MIPACVASPPKPADVTAARLRREAGPIRLAAEPAHRLLVHASAATWGYCIGSRRLFLRRCGHIDILPAGEEGGFDAETPCELLELRLPPGLVERVAEDSGRAAGARLETRHLLEDEPLRHLAWALDGAGRGAAPPDRLFVDSLGVALATRLLAFAAPAAPALRRGLSPAQLRRVREHIEAHLDEPLPLEALARVAGASSASLRHWFKAETGVTVHRYVVRRRVERARALLLGGMRASEAALESGFAHQSHMARWMQRELGISPRELAQRTSS